MTIPDGTTVFVVYGRLGYQFKLTPPSTKGMDVGQMLIVINSSDSPTTSLVTQPGGSRIFVFTGSRFV